MSLSDPDSFLCLPVVYRCCLKALKCLLGQMDHILLMQSRLPQFVFNVLLTLCFYYGMKGCYSASGVKALSQQTLLAW